MKPPPHLGEAVAEVAGASCCRHPVRLRVHAADATSGELAERTILVACKDRRAILCPACAATYQADAFQIVAAGLRGGKGVPATVASHPTCFVTLTAPSFGAVHGRPPQPSASAPCRPRRRTRCCTHGVELACLEHHDAGDPAVGRPLCVACFDYEGAVAWNARVSALWQRTSVAAARSLARAAGVRVRDQSRTFRLSYLKVVEFQRRGLVHLHVVVRADGSEGPGDDPPGWLDAALLAQAIEDSTARVEVPGLSGPESVGNPARWGDQRTVAVLGGGDHLAVASYLAKYAVKAATADPVLTRRLDARRRPRLEGTDPHPAALVMAAWRLGGVRSLKGLRLRAHAHTFGYGGHFATKSQLWSTTFGALRQARSAFAAGLDDEPKFVALADSWRYAGRGYGSADAEHLADLLADGIARRPRRIPAVSPTVTEHGPHAGDQGR